MQEIMLVLAIIGTIATLVALVSGVATRIWDFLIKITDQMIK